MWSVSNRSTKGSVKPDLKESLQPPDLKDTFADKHNQLKDAPPFDPCVGALGCISVSSFPYDNVTLLILHLCHKLGECAD